MAKAATPRNIKTEAEKYQQQYDVAARKVERKAAQIAKAQAVLDRLTKEQASLRATRDFLAGHPEVKAEKASTA